MTRLEQALRWWRGRKCECRSEDFSEIHSKVVLETSIPVRHRAVLVKAGRLKFLRCSGVAPAYYFLLLVPGCDLLDYHTHDPASR